MSDSEVPRQSDPADNFDQLELPPIPARWDDPPSALSENDLMRMVPGRCDDRLLNAVSDALWEPVDLNESPAVHAERLKSITRAGAQLRERWAETAALEEAFKAPTVPMQVRMRRAKARKARGVRAHTRRRRRQRRLRALTFWLSAGAAQGLLVSMIVVGVERHGCLGLPGHCRGIPGPTRSLDRPLGSPDAR